MRYLNLDRALSHILYFTYSIFSLSLVSQLIVSHPCAGPWCESWSNAHLLGYLVHSLTHLLRLLFDKLCVCFYVVDDPLLLHLIFLCLFDLTSELECVESKHTHVVADGI